MSIETTIAARTRSFQRLVEVASRVMCRETLTLALIVSACLGCEPTPQSSPPSAPMSETSDKQVVTPPPPPTPSPPSDAGSEDAGQKGKRLFVREAYADCEGESRRKCLQVRESADEDWTFFYGRIEGFTYEEGNRYELLVESIDVPNPPSDAPRTRLRLVEIVSKEPVGN